MNITRSEIEILKIFEHYSSLSLEELANILEINLATLKKKLTKLSKFLKDYELGKIIYTKKNVQVEIDLNKLKTININTDLKEIKIDAQARFFYIIILLIFEKKIELIKLVGLFDVTINTLILDLRKVKNFVSKFNLDVHSTQFLGVTLVGSKNLKVKFSIKVLLKYFLEYEFNSTSAKLSATYINPFVANYLNKKFETLDIERINNLTESIIENLDIDPDMYIFVTIKTTIAYLFIEKFDNNFTPNITFRGEKRKIYLELIKIFDKNTNKNIKFLIFLLVKIIHRHKYHYPIRYIQKNHIFNILVEKIERIYVMKLSVDEKNQLFEIVYKSTYKYLFNIKNYDNNYSIKSDIPKSILNDLNLSIKNNKIKLLKEDLYIVALFIYYKVCDYYKRNSLKLNLLVIDYSIQSWIGNGFVKELKRYLPDISYSIHSKIILNKEYLDFEKFDYIIFLNKIDKEKLLLNNKVIYLNYRDHFEINSFFGHLLFGREVED